MLNIKQKFLLLKKSDSLTLNYVETSCIVYYIHVCTYMHTNMCICAYTYIYTHTNMCMFAYAYEYI